MDKSLDSEVKSLLNVHAHLLQPPRVGLGRATLTMGTISGVLQSKAFESQPGTVGG